MCYPDYHSKEQCVFTILLSIFVCMYVCVVNVYFYSSSLYYIMHAFYSFIYIYFIYYKYVQISWVQFPFSPLLQSLSLPHLTSPPDPLSSVSPQTRAGLPRTSAKHRITSSKKTRHKPSHQDGAREPSRKKREPQAGKSHRQPRFSLLGIR